MLTGEWQCFGGLGCIEVKTAYGKVLLRDNRQPDVMIEADPESWQAFLGGAKTGEFDLP